MSDEDRTPDQSGAPGDEPTEPTERLGDEATEPTEQQPAEEPKGSTEQQRAAEAGEAETRQLPPAGATAEQPRRLLRSRSDKMVAGVAGGLGRYFGVDPVIFRIAFGVSVFFGGLGVLAYIALAIFVPAGDGEHVESAPYERSRWLGVAAGVALVLLLVPAIGFGLFWDSDWGWAPWGLLWLIVPVAIALGAYGVLRDRRERGERFSPGGVFAAILLVFATLVAFSVLAVVGAFATATGHGLAIALTVTAIGGLLIVAAFAGGARWLIVPAAALATGVGVAAAADLEFSGGIGEEVHRPASITALPADGYEHGVGRLEIDLRDLAWSPHQVTELNVDLGIGQAVVGVPSRVCVESDLHTGAGDLQVAGEESDGVDADLDRNTGSSATPRLVLTGEVDLGQFVVINDDDRDLDEAGRHRFGHANDEDEELQAAAATACAH